MHPNFAVLDPHWFKRAFVYTGSIGDFRYRFVQNKDNNTIETSVYTKFCFEVATDIVTQEFPWNDDGINELKIWIQSHFEKYQSTGKIQI